MKHLKWGAVITYDSNLLVGRPVGVQPRGFPAAQTAYGHKVWFLAEYYGAAVEDVMEPVGTVDVVIELNMNESAVI